MRKLLVFLLIIPFRLISQESECFTDEYIENSSNGFGGVGADCFNFTNPLKTEGCEDHRKYAPLVPTFKPIKKIQVYFHVFQKDDGTRNFEDNQKDRALLESVIDEDNIIYSNVQHMDWTPACASTYIADTRIRFELAGILYHQDSDAWCAADHANQNPHGCDVYDLYVKNNPNLSPSQKSDAIHVFIMGCRKVIATGQEVFVIGGYASGIPASSDKFIAVKGWYYNSIEHPNGDPETYLRGEVATNLAHEFGHTFGLWHTFNGDEVCDTYDVYQSTNNLMDYLGGRNITEGQLARIHYLLEGKCDENNDCYDIHNSVITDYCNKDDSYDIVIPSGQTVIWDIDRIVNNDIVIEPLAELIIRCRLGMPSQGTITVNQGARLFVDGGTITHNKTMWGKCHSGQWQSIIVYGNPNLQQNPSMQSETYPLTAGGHGFVIIKNGTIEYARHAISTATHSNGSTWGGGGFVYADNSDFINNMRTGEFLLYQFPSFSKFYKCRFKNLDGTANTGVSDWACNGLQFEECTFTGINNVGVLAYDAAITVTKSGFTGSTNGQGINAIGTRPLTGYVQIGLEGAANSRNTFTNNYTGIYSTNVDKLRVFNNGFGTNKFGISVNGTSGSVIEYNTFTNNTFAASDFVSLGFFQNIIACNSYNSEFIGMDMSGNNLGAYINSQTFQSVYDLNLSHEGTFPGQQGQLNDFGQQGSAFFNYFSNGAGLTNLQHINTIGNTSTFNYFYPNTGTYPRSKPKCTLNDPGTCIAPNNFYSYLSNGSPISCASFAPPSYCHTESCLQPILNQINYWDSIRSQRNLDSSEQFTVTNLEMQRDNGILNITRDFLDSLRFDSASTFLQGFNLQFAKRLLFSVKLNQGDTSAANTILQNYQTLNTDDQYFKYCQGINLSLIQSGFTITQSQREQLQTISASSEFSSAYAKGLLTIIDGQLFNPTIPDLVDPRSRGNTSTDNNDGLIAYPNPSNGELTIFLPKKDYLNAVLTITDLNGNVVWKSNIGYKTRIELSLNLKGFYMINLRDDTGVNLVNKIVIN